MILNQQQFAEAFEEAARRLERVWLERTKMSEGFLPPLMANPEPTSRVAQIKMLWGLGHFQGMSNLDILEVLKDGAGVADAIASWQAYHSRPVTGQLSYADAAILTAPRCAIADIMQVRGDGIAQWGVKQITISHSLKGMNRLTQDDIDAAYSAAVDSWNKVCGIEMKLVPWAGNGATNIWARALKIDGAGSTLAWSYLPGDDSPITARLEQRYDPGESWTRQYLQGVAAHEIGHALGLEHSNAKADLMYPYARPDLFLPQAGDISRVVTRYGKPTAAPPIDPPVDPPTAPSSVKKVTVTLGDGSTVECVPRDSIYDFA